ncbi:MAG: alpha/beta hydrolase [Fimbriimonadales bacterium]|nr:alpha/beta hydrolase [Fimbriimonadales bacterium]
MKTLMAMTAHNSNLGKRPRRRAGCVIGLALLLGGVALFYLWPVPAVPFEQLYAGVPPAQAQALQAFRKAHPLRSVVVDGVEWRYLAAGKGKHTILLLHGMTGAPDIWFQQIDALQNEYRFIAVTYPPVPTLEAMEQGVRAILEREDVPRCAVVGSSLGGYLAQYLVQKHPQRFTHAVFANTFPPNETIERENRGRAALLPWLPNWLVMRFVRQNVEQVVVPAAGDDPLTRAFLREMTYGRMNKTQFLARYRCIIERFPVNPVSIPVLIIESENDPLVQPALRQQLRVLYPKARVHTFSDAGHFPYLNQPEAFTRLLREFVR